MTERKDVIRYHIEGMDCASCATKIETAVGRLGGVKEVAVSATAGTMRVSLDDAGHAAEIERTVRALGYGIRSRGGGGALPQAAGPAVDGLDAHHDHTGHDHAHEDHHHGDEQQYSHDREPQEPELPAGLHGHDHGHGTGPWWKSGKARLTLFSGASLVLAYAAGQFLPAVASYLFVAAMLVGLLPIARRALAAAIAGIPFTIETLMTIAAVGAVIIGAGEEAAMVVLLFLVGELLEGIAAGRARDSIRSLTSLVPKRALVEVDGKLRDVDAESLAIGDLILVRPGDRIPADGTIMDGESAIDEAPVTGESVPVRRKKGQPVFAGTINGEAVLKVQVTAEASDNTIARVVRLVEEAQESKSPTERFIDRFSRYYTPGVLLAGALVAVVPPAFAGASWPEWIYKGLAVLLIGCPCALVISTPAAIAASLSAGARRGLLMKGGVVLERVGKLNAIALDKTGTLTEGRPKVTDIVAAGKSEAEVLALAAALEAGSSHPLAVAILARAGEDGVTAPAVESSRAIAGKGVAASMAGVELFLGSPQAATEQAAFPQAFSDQIGRLNQEGKTVSVLLADGTLAGAIAMRDEPREDAIHGLAALRALGVRVVMLTGDNRRTAEAIGAQLGIGDVRAELLPADKQKIVNELRDAGLIVGKIGDGINDAPALAAAEIGIAMGGGTDVALETADAAILHGRVGDIARMMQLSRRTMSNIAQNITIALGLKAVFLVTTIMGITGLWPAILADTGATVLVTMNALRLLSPPSESSARR